MRVYLWCLTETGIMAHIGVSPNSSQHGSLNSGSDYNMGPFVNSLCFGCSNFVQLPYGHGQASLQGDEIGTI